jgi:hypothetical protein
MREFLMDAHKQTGLTNMREPIMPPMACTPKASIRLHVLGFWSRPNLFLRKTQT